MVSARINVAPPSFTPGRYGLSSVVDWRTGDTHWRGGVEWENVCGNADTTYDECVQENAIDGETLIGEPTTKSFTAVKSTFGATPFTVYAEVDCSAVGFYDSANAWATKALIENEDYLLEQTFWTGAVDGVSDLATPHLASNTLLVDDSSVIPVTLQLAATVVTGTPVCAQVALGALEQRFAECYRGTGIIHAPVGLASIFAEAYLLEEEDDGVLYTTNGNIVVFGRGYRGTAPDGTMTANALWMYMTPRIFGYRGDIRVNPEESNLTRTVDTVRAIAERTYLLGYDCCLVGTPVSTECL